MQGPFYAKRVFRATQMACSPFPDTGARGAMIHPFRVIFVGEDGQVYTALSSKDYRSEKFSNLAEGLEWLLEDR